MVKQNLYQLVTQLPNGERWEFGKWQIEYELTRQDKKACNLLIMSQKLISKILANGSHFLALISERSIKIYI